MTEPIMIEVGAGELLDKISILQIKSERMTNPAQLKNIKLELELLEAVRQDKLPDTDELTKLMAELKATNEALWDIEDDIRRCEASKDFGEKFIRLARAVYVSNDKRAELKKSINVLAGARIVEEKSYDDY